MRMSKVCAVALIGLISASAAQAQTDIKAADIPAAKAYEELGYTMGVQAFIWGYPLWQAEQSRRAMTAVTAPQGFRAPTNEYFRGDRLADPTDKEVVSPNNDTLYSGSWLDLRNEPMVLHLPDYAGRYYSVEIVDAYTNNVAYISQRRDGFKAQTVAFVAPGWTGKIPDGIRRIDVPTPTTFVVIRSGVDGPEDIKNVKALEDQIAFVPLSKWGQTYVPPPTVPIVPPKSYAGPLAFWQELGDLVVANPPPEHDNGLFGLFKDIGLTRNGFDATNINPDILRGLERAHDVGLANAMLTNRNDGQTVNGWLFRRQFTGSYFGTSYLLRAGIAFGGLFSNDQAEAVYPVTHKDINGKQLDGSNNRAYAIRFEKGGLPPVDAFWSLTMLDYAHGFLVANPISRYSIGDRTKGLVTAPDGSLTIYMQNQSPGKDKESNWLPAPDGPFRLVMRLYMPKQSVTNMQWAPPAIKSTAP